MAVTFVNKGAFASGAAGLTVAQPAGIAAGDLLLLLVESANQPVAAPSGYTQVANSPQGTGTAAAAGGVAVQAFYKVAGASEASVSVADSGDHTTAIILAFRGVDQTAPIDVTAGGVQAATTAMSWPGVTTTAANAWLVLACGQDTDAASTATASGYANAALANLVERHDQTVTSGAGGGLVVVTAEKAVAGATGATTATGSTSVTHAYLTIALRPAAVVVDLAGAAAAAALATAQLAIDKALASSAAALAGASADLSVAAPGVDLGATASAQASATADLLKGVSLAGAALGVATASGNMSLAVPLTATAVAAAASSGQISLVVVLGGAALAQAATLADLALTHTLAASGAAQASSNASLSVDKPLAAQGLATANSTASLALIVNLNAAALAQATGTASLGGGAAATLAADARATSNSQASLWLDVPLSAAALAQAAGGGELKLIMNLSAAALAQADSGGTLAGSASVTLAAGAMAWAQAVAGLQVLSALNGPRGQSLKPDKRNFKVPAQPRSWAAAKVIRRWTAQA